MWGVSTWGGRLWGGRQGEQYPLESLACEGGCPRDLPPPPPGAQLLRVEKERAAQTGAVGPRGSSSRSAPHMKPEAGVT